MTDESMPPEWREFQQEPKNPVEDYPYTALKSVLPLEAIIHEPWCRDGGQNMTKDQFVAAIPSMAARWQEIADTFTRNGKLYKPVGPEFCLYRVNKLELLVGPNLRVFGYATLDPANPADKIARDMCGTQYLREWRKNYLNQSSWDPATKYKKGAREYLDPDIWEQLRRQTFLLATIADVRKNYLKLRPEEVNMAVVPMQPAELSIICAQAKITLAIMEAVKNGVKIFDQQSIAKYLEVALRPYDPQIPGLDEAKVKRHLGRYYNKLEEIREKAANFFE